MYRTDDPVRDFLRYDREREREEARLPKCSICGEPILDEFLFDFDGELMCEECTKMQFRKPTSDYVGE